MTAAACALTHLEACAHGTHHGDLTTSHGALNKPKYEGAGAETHSPEKKPMASAPVEKGPTEDEAAAEACEKAEAEKQAADDRAIAELEGLSDGD